MKKGIRIALKAVLLLFLLLLILFGVFIYQTEWRITFRDKYTSPDGIYTLYLQEIGEPDFPFGAAHGRFLLKENGKTVVKHEFEVLDDGGPLTPEMVQVTWEETAAVAIVSASEQDDMCYCLFFSGSATEAVHGE